MKYTLTFILSFFYFLSNAQNGGQFSENNLIKVEYLGYFNGNHTAKVCNKQNCEARIRTKADQDPAMDVIVPANECVIVTVARSTSAAVLFRAKAEKSCPSFTNPDMGWVEIDFISCVLNLVDDNRIVVIRGPNKLEISLIGGILNTNYDMVDYTQTIKICNITGVVRYKNVIFVRKSNQINLNNYLHNGLNFIEIMIDNKKIDRFLFKYIK